MHSDMPQQPVQLHTRIPQILPIKNQITHLVFKMYSHFDFGIIKQAACNRIFNIYRPHSTGF